MMKNNNQKDQSVINDKKRRNSNNNNTTNSSNGNSNKKIKKKTTEEQIGEYLLVLHSENTIEELNDIFNNKLQSTTNDHTIVQVALEKLVQKNYNCDIICSYDKKGEIHANTICQYISRNHYLSSIIGIMYRFIEQLDVIIPALSVLSSYTNHQKQHKKLSFPVDTAISVMDVTILSMQIHPDHSLLQLVSCSILCNILTYYSCNNRKAAINKSAKDRNILKLIVNVMGKHPDDEDLQIIACDILDLYYKSITTIDDKKIMKDTCLSVLGKAICHESNQVCKIAAELMKKICNDIISKRHE